MPFRILSRREFGEFDIPVMIVAIFRVFENFLLKSLNSRLFELKNVFP